MRRTKDIRGIPSLVERVANIPQNKLRTGNVHYKMQYLSCSSSVASRNFSLSQPTEHTPR